MATMEEVAKALSNEQVSVICLDTCDFLDVVRGVAEGNLFHVQSFQKILDRLEVDPRRFQVVITYLVRHEWEQSKADVSRKVEAFLKETTNSVQRIAEARTRGGLPRVNVEIGLFDVELAQSLVELAETVMGYATVLEKDPSCVTLAVDRVMARRRPSHKNEIKDSIHWEHYLKLSRLLATEGHGQDRFFISANKADFWADKNTPTIHPDLEAEAKASGLRFFGRLDEALKALGV